MQIEPFIVGLIEKRRYTIISGQKKRATIADSPLSFLITKHKKRAYECSCQYVMIYNLRNYTLLHVDIFTQVNTKKKWIFLYMRLYAP